MVGEPLEKFSQDY